MGIIHQPIWVGGMEICYVMIFIRDRLQIVRIITGSKPDLELKIPIFIFADVA